MVGAGFLGAEAAAVARRLGVRVTLLEPAALPLAHAVGTEVGRLLARAHVDRGVDLRCGVTVTEVTEEGVRLAGGEVVEADEVLVAVGSQPNTEWLEGSGLPLGDGVVCDEYCEAAENVYAAGDVARGYNPLFATSMRVEHRTNAAEQGMAAARNLLAAPEARKPFAPVPYFWSDQYDMKVQAYGFLRGHEEVALVEGTWRSTGSSPCTARGTGSAVRSRSACHPRSSGSGGRPSRLEQPGATRSGRRRGRSRSEGGAMCRPSTVVYLSYATRW